MKTITDFFIQGGTAATLIILSLTICLGLMLGKVKIKGFSLEYRLFSQISRSWSGTPLFSIADACRRAANTVTKKGLKVFAEIVDKVYETKRKVNESFIVRLANQVVFDDSLHNWNYCISSSVSYHVIF